MPVGWSWRKPLWMIVEGRLERRARSTCYFVSRSTSTVVRNILVSLDIDKHSWSNTLESRMRSMIVVTHSHLESTYP